MSALDPRDAAREVAEYPIAHAPIRDAIGEDDNPIPLWFNISFYSMIVVGLIYLVYYSISGWSAASQYDAELLAFGERYPTIETDLAASNPFRGDESALAAGKQTFSTVCAACHKPEGTGLIGPSLVDPYSKYGSDDAALFESVAEGRPGGMPAWGVQLSDEKIWQALAYLETLPREEEPGVGAPPAEPEPGAGATAAPADAQSGS